MKVFLLYLKTQNINESFYLLTYLGIYYFLVRKLAFCHIILLDVANDPRIKRNVSVNLIMCFNLFCEPLTGSLFVLLK